MVLAGSLVERKELIKCNTIDNILYNKILRFNEGILKIDVEGAEYEVLCGCKKILTSKKIKFIQLENLFFLDKKKSKKKQIEKLLIEYNYKKIKKFTFPTLHFSDEIYKLYEQN